MTGLLAALAARSLADAVVLDALAARDATATELDDA
jgi:hypothetical protein